LDNYGCIKPLQVKLITSGKYSPRHVALQSPSDIIKEEVKISLLQAVEAPRFVRVRGSHITETNG
jgi:hypothetical protein